MISIEFKCSYNVLHYLNTQYNLCYNLSKRFTSTVHQRHGADDYCTTLVKKHDYENFLATLLLPKNAREHVFAVRAFNVEIAIVGDASKEVLMSMMRMQFWKDTLDDIYKGSPPSHPVALELAKAVETCELSKLWLKNLIASRENIIQNNQFADVSAIEKYTEKSNSSLYFLILQTLGIDNVDADHAASHIGKGEGIVRIIRSVPHFAMRRTVLLPQDLMIKHGISQEEVIRGSREQKLKDLIYELASISHIHIDHGRGLKTKIQREGQLALLPAVNVSTYLTALQKADFDIFEPRLNFKSWTAAHLLWAKLKRTY